MLAQNLSNLSSMYFTAEKHERIIHFKTMNTARPLHTTFGHISLSNFAFLQFDSVHQLLFFALKASSPHDFHENQTKKQKVILLILMRKLALNMMKSRNFEHSRQNFLKETKELRHCKSCTVNTAWALRTPK